jgi:flagellar biosynthetic protein FlhB
MAEERNESASKTEEPTQRRLDEARRKGDVARSMEPPAFLALAAVAATLVWVGGAASRDIAAQLMIFIARPDAFHLGGADGVGVLQLALRAAAPGAAIMGVAAGGAVVGNLVQTGFIWAPSKLAPDPSKISPMQGFTRLFGPDGLVNFLKSLAKLTAVAVVAWMVLKPRTETLAVLGRMEVSGILPLAADWLQALAVAVLVVFGAIALADWLWQRQRFMQKMRMSREELKEDTKDSEGDPQIKAKLRQQRMARARRRMIQNVPKATMVVMNPTHYAVALRYVQGETAAPVCVAKGVDAVALKIKAVALAHRIAVIEDPPLARALYAAIDIDDTIPREHYEAVAKLVGTVMGRGKRRAGSASPPRPARL